MKIIIISLIYSLFTQTFAAESSNLSENILLKKSINLKTAQSLSNEKKSSYQVFYFWATWCPDCKEKLKKDLHQYQNDVTDFSTFSIEKDKDRITAFIEKNKIAYPVYFDTDKELQKQLKVFSVPTVVLAQITQNEIKIIKTISGKDWSALDQEIEILKKGMIK